MIDNRSQSCKLLENDHISVSRKKEVLKMVERSKRRKARKAAKNLLKKMEVKSAIPVKKQTQKQNTPVVKTGFAGMPIYTKGMGNQFYQTQEWRKLRFEVIREQGSTCKCCGRTREHGIVLHVDHIMPRWKFPELELTKSNLQVLCEDCNLGKGGSY